MWRIICMDSRRGSGNLLHWSDKGVRSEVDILALEIVDQDGQAAVSLHLL